MDEETYKDALEPLTSEPYKNIKDFTPDPFIKNRQAFITTAYYKNEAYERNLKMMDDMINLKGTFCLGADYKMACKFGRGRTEEEIDALEEKVGKIFFDFNYRSVWGSSNTACIVDINKLHQAQILQIPELKPTKDGEYYVCADIARSAKSSNNATAIAILRVRRDKNEKVKSIQVVNIIKPENGQTFQTQALIIRKYYALYKARAIVLDVVGVGSAIRDLLLEPQVDPQTGVEHPALTPFNEEIQSDEKDAIEAIWSVYAQKYNTQYILAFQNCIDNGMLQLLEKVDSNKILEAETEDVKTSEILAKIRTQGFIDETSNVTIKTVSGGRLQLDQQIKADKDIFSAIMYGVGYILSECNNGVDEEYFDISDYYAYSPIRVR